VPRGQREGSLRLYSRFSRPEKLLFIHEAEWTPFQTHYFSENLDAPGSEAWSSEFHHYSLKLFMLSKIMHLCIYLPDINSRTALPLQIVNLTDQVVI
jgi:hypothetical protein